MSVILNSQVHMFNYSFVLVEILSNHLIYNLFIKKANNVYNK
jgi:hypothetical protein